MALNKILLASALCMIFALPSYADIASGASSATCDNSTIGATEGSTDLEAQWSANQYSENPGYYLLYANNTVSTNQTCTAGNYCPGFTNQTFADATMGLNSCATNDANFPNSDAGASAATDCYRACNINNVGTSISSMPHATAISGNDYYGAGTDTCIATACESGYTPTGLPEGVGPLASYADLTPTSIRYKSLDGNGNNSEDTTGLNNGEWDVTWSDGTVIKGSSTCVDATVTKAISNDGYILIASNIHPSTDFTAGDYGVKDGEGGGKSKCFCRMDGYTLSGSNTVNTASSPWAYFGQTFFNMESQCAKLCTYACASISQAYSVFRSAIFGDLGGETHACAANVINITWDKKNGEANVTNQCTYGGAVTIPEQPSKTGYTFGGWRIKPTPSNNE